MEIGIQLVINQALFFSL